MKLSFNTIAYRFSNLNLFEIVDKIEEWKYDGIEIWEPHLSVVNDYYELNDYLINSKIIPSCLISYSNPIEIIDNSKAETEFIQLLSSCKIINCKKIRIFAGNRDSFSAKKEFINLIDSINHISEICSDYGVTVLVETHHDTYADSTKSTIELFKCLNRNVYCLLDLANLLESSTNYFDAYSQLIEFTRHMHLKNVYMKKGIYENPFREVMTTNNITLPTLKEGYIDYGVLLSELRMNTDIEWLTLEWFGSNIEVIANTELEYLKTFI